MKRKQQQQKSNTTTTTSRPRGKKVEQVNDLIQPCLNQIKQITIVKEWYQEIASNQTKLENLKPGENLPLVFLENGLNFDVNIVKCDFIFLNNKMIGSNFIGKVKLNTKFYQIEGEVNEISLRGKAKLTELDLLAINEEAVNIPQLDTCSNSSNVAACDEDSNERIDIVIKQKQFDFEKEVIVIPEDTKPTSSTIETAATSSTTPKVPWSKKNYLLKNYQE